MSRQSLLLFAVVSFLAASGVAMAQVAEVSRTPEDAQRLQEAQRRAKFLEWLNDRARLRPEAAVPNIVIVPPLGPAAQRTFRLSTWFMEKAGLVIRDEPHQQRLFELLVGYSDRGDISLGCEAYCCQVVRSLADDELAAFLSELQRIALFAIVSHYEERRRFGVLP